MAGPAPHFDTIGPRVTCWCEVWPIFTAVVHRGRNAHVVTVPPLFVKEEGHVPIMLDEASGECIVVPADELSLRFPERAVGTIKVVPDTP